MNNRKLWLSICAIVVNIHYISGSAIIGNGQVILGVNDEGHLNTPYVGGVLGLPASDPLSINNVGLRNGNGETGLFASTEPGCLCEGWGVAVPNLGLTVYANRAVDGGANNMVLISFTGNNGDDSATSIIRDRRRNLRVTHYFHPAFKSDYAMRVDVTIKNTGSSNFDSTLYRRVMDWDIHPTPFSEFVTIIGTDSSKLVLSNDNGFCSANPLRACNERTAGTTNVDFVDSGPSDHGANFDFDLGPLAPGESVRFKIFYGVAPGEKYAMRALHDIGAEVASLGQQRDSPKAGLPYTFFFAFGNVGGETIEAGNTTTTTPPDCGCYSTTLIGQKPVGPAGFGSCYRYQINMCDTRVDTVVLGRAKAQDKCGRDIDLSDVVLSTQRKGVSFDLAYDETGSGGLRVRGVQIRGLYDGDTFRICFNATEVYGLIPGGNVEYQNDMGLELTCPASDMLFDLCPEVGPSAAESVGANNYVPDENYNQYQFIEQYKDNEHENKGGFDGKDTVNAVGINAEEEMETMMTMTFVWSALISLVVSMIVVFVAYITCIRPEMKGNGNKGRYDFNKMELTEDELDEEEKDVI